MAYTAYATLASLATYLAVDVGDLSADSQRLLNRANELVKHLTLNNIDEDDTDHMSAASSAACAQVEFWNSLGEQTALSTNVSSFRIGNFSMNYGGGSSGAGGSSNNQVAPRTKSFLSEEGLLYKGVTMYANS